MPGELEEHYISLYRRESDEQLYQRLRDLAAQLGRLPLKSEVPASFYLKVRLGKWPRILEQAGLKPVSENRQGKIERRVGKRTRTRRNRGKV